MTRFTLAAAGSAMMALAVLGCTSDETASPTTPSAGTAAPSISTSDTPLSTTTEEADAGDVGATPEPGQGESTGPLGSTELRVETDAGTVQIGSGSVPDGLGGAFPLPRDLEVLLASETDEELGFSGDTQLAFDELVELFEAGLPDAGYVIDSVDVRGTDVAVIEFSDVDGIGEVVVTRSTSPGAHTVIVTFGPGSRAQN